jgi:hypothetical protein
MWNLFSSNIIHTDMNSIHSFFYFLLHFSVIHINHHQVEKCRYRRKSATERASPYSKVHLIPTVNTALCNNHLNLKVLSELKWKLVTHKEKMEGSNINKNKLCVSFTYAGMETKFITNFKNHRCQYIV